MADAPPAPARTAAFARGVAAEAAAAALFEAAGFAVLARRARTPLGEIDLVVRRGGLVVFVEVKARARLALAAESLGPRQRRRIAAAAEVFLAARPELDGLDARFDVVLVDPRGVPRHLPAAFRADD
ncbi:MAG TPA: YraN family protein [Xanthobacteraceae bacterium]|nr:YraN family protein [Xanthobacteraceae bacterium]